MPSPVEYPTRHWQHCLQIARDAAADQPNNAFYPVCEAYFSQVIGDEKTAKQALQRSSTCTEYQTFNYFENTMSQRLRYGASILPFEIRQNNVYIPAGTDYSLDSFAALKQRQGIRSWRRGDKHQAIEYFEQALCVARAQLKSPESPTAIWFGVRTLSSIWNSLEPDNRKLGSEPDTPENFITLLRRAGRPDLIPAVKADSQHPAHRLVLVSPWYSLLPDPARWEFIRISYPIAGYAARTALWAAALWFSLGILPAIRIRTFDLLRVHRISLLLASAPLALFGFDLYSSSSLSSESQNYPAGFMPAVREVRLAAFTLTVALTLLPLLISRFRIPGPRSANSTLPLPKSWPLPRNVTPYVILLTVAVALSAVTYFQYRGIISIPYLRWPFMAFISFLPVSAMVGLPFYYRHQRQTQYSRERFSWVPLFRFLLKFPPFLANALALIRAVSGTVALSASLTYLSLSLIVAPYRHLQENYLDEMERRGPIPVWMETLGIRE